MVPWPLPLVLVMLFYWLHSPPATLAEAARHETLRRQLRPSAVTALTDADVERLPPRALPPSPAPVAEAASSGPVTAPRPEGASSPVAGREVEVQRGARDEAWWRGQAASLRAALERDRVLTEALQSRVNGLTADSSARDDPAQRQELLEARTKVIAELERMRSQAARDRVAIADLAEAARRENVPAGWLR
jgi:hypothetical protein